MKTLIKISWRNIWRNSGRSIVIILAVAFGLWGGVFITGFMTGMLTQMFDSGIKSQVSHIQIHNHDFIKEKLTEFYIEDYESIIGVIEKNDKVHAYSARTLSNGMIATASMTAGIEIYAVNPPQENKTTDLRKNIIEGDYFESVSRNPVLIGEKLSQKMNINAGNRIILTFQDLNGNITSASFRVCGIYRTSNTMNDERKVFIKQNDFANLIDNPGVVNEIAILLTNIDDVDEFKTMLSDEFPDTEIRTWLQLAPELSFMNEMSGMAMMVILIIILLALAFGILNTMLMAIFERTRELGVLMSVGMNKFKVFSMILLETIFLVVSGSVIGTVMGYITISITSKTGIDLTAIGGDTFSDYGIDAMVYPRLEDMFFLDLAILVIITAIVASIYPSYKALKLNPADAVRKE